MNNKHDDDDEIPENFWIIFFEQTGWLALKIMIWVVIFLAVVDWLGKK